MPGYKVKNVVGEVQTRVHRWVAPKTSKNKQMIGLHRLLPKQSVDLSDEHYRIHESVILDKVKRGELMVTTPDGTIITSTPGGDLVYRNPSNTVTEVVQAEEPAVQEQESSPSSPEEVPTEEKTGDDTVVVRRRKGRR
jgi:hypothetical protein